MLICNYRNKFFPVTLLIAFVALVMSGCGSSDKDDPGGGDVPKVEVALSRPVVTAEDNAQFMNVECDGYWEITFEYPEGVSEWCSTDESTQSGTGNAKNVRLLYSVNRSKDDRSATVVLKSANGEDKAVLLQKGYTTTPPVDPEPGPDPDPDPNPNPVPVTVEWLELPKVDAKTGCKFISHNTTISGKVVRNYSMFYDTNEKVAYWVAYPHIKSYIGSSGRTDAWNYDPKISQSEQVNLKKGVSGYDRGHQIPSGDRTANSETNRQTFYYTNMTPQLSGLNQKWWANLENKVRGWVNSTDTLYVVTGAILKTTNGNENIKYARDNNNVPMAIPNYYYKVLLQKYAGNGNIHGYRSIGFWVDHAALSGTDYVTKARSVRDIENLTGFDFFTNLDPAVRDDVETAYKPAAWGL